MEIRSFLTDELGSAYVAACIAERIQEKAAENEYIVLGLATGSSPLTLYDELIRLHKEEGLSFSNVITFNLDEYYPIASDSNQSYYKFMHDKLFNHVDIKPENINLLDGAARIDQIPSICKSYEEKIKAAGGIDIQVLGIGRTGHIGFNEPGSAINSITRLVKLNEITRTDAALDFGAMYKVPSKAITMGMDSILKAKKIFLLAWGEKKAEVIRECFLELKNVTEELPAFFLKEKKNVEIILDSGSAKFIHADSEEYDIPFL